MPSSTSASVAVSQGRKKRTVFNANQTTWLNARLGAFQATPSNEQAAWKAGTADEAVEDPVFDTLECGDLTREACLFFILMAHNLTSSLP